MRTIHYSSMLFFKTAALLGLLSFSVGSPAEVFKCVDKATGKMAFTDKACPDNTTGDYLPVGKTNSDAGYDSNATSREKQIRNAADNANRSKWQQHNSQVSNEAQETREQKEGERNSKIDRVKSEVSFENSMAKKQCSRNYSIEYCRSVYGQ